MSAAPATLSDIARAIDFRQHMQRVRDRAEKCARAHGYRPGGKCESCGGDIQPGDWCSYHHGGGVPRGESPGSCEGCAEAYAADYRLERSSW